MNFKRLCAFLLVSIAALIVVIACARRPYAATQDEAIYGTWGYENSHPVKVIMYPDGRYEEFLLLKDEKPWYIGKYEIADRSSDNDGNITYRINYTNYEPMYILSQALCKISRDRERLERDYNPVGSFGDKAWPNEINPNHGSYMLYMKMK